MRKMSLRGSLSAEKLQPLRMFVSGQPKPHVKKSHLKTGKV